MIIRGLLLILALLFATAVIRLLWMRWQEAGGAPADAPGKINRPLLWLLAGILILLFIAALAGWLHWLFAVPAAVLPWLLRAVLLPILAGKIGNMFEQRMAASAGRSDARNPGNLSRQEALDLLGLSGTPDRQTIIAMHRKLIQKIHPDQGGNDYLATRINMARDLLLQELQD